MLDLGEKWRATFMEVWPSDLWEFTLPAVEIALSEADRLKIGSATPFFAEHFELAGRDPDALDCEADLVEALEDMADTGAFLRMGSASFKRQGALNLPIVNIGQAIDTIRSPNDRAARFVGDSLVHAYPLSLFVFPWRVVEPWTEIRLFVREGALVGASQYHCDKRYEALHKALPTLQKKVAMFWRALAPELPMPDVIVDLFIETDTDGQLGEVRLIELNPFIQRADTCLFDWKRPDGFDGSFRYVS